MKKHAKSPSSITFSLDLAMFSRIFPPDLAAPGAPVLLSPLHRRQRRGLLGLRPRAHGEAQQAALLRGEALQWMHYSEIPFHTSIF